MADPDGGALPGGAEGDLGPGRKAGRAGEPVKGQGSRRWLPDRQRSVYTVKRRKARSGGQARRKSFRSTSVTIGLKRQGLERGNRFVPEGREGKGGAFQSGRVKAIDLGRAKAFGPDHPGSPQHRQMPGNRGAGHRETFGQRRDAERFLREQAQNGPPRPVAKGIKGGIGFYR